VNPAARSLIDGSQGEVIGEPVSALLPLAGPILTSSRAGTEVREEVSIEREGEELYYELRVSDVANDRGQPIGRLIVLHDVTARREAMRQLYRQERLAAIGQLASGIAHDFNNLLGSIMLNAQLVQQQIDDLPYTAEESLDVIVQESRYGADLVAQILDFSRSGLAESKPLDLSCFVRDVSDVLRRTVREDIELVVETPSRPCIVAADPTRMQQVLLNLVTNARDAMPSGGELRITVEGPPWPSREVPKDHRIPPVGWACLAVSDTGTGIDEAVRDHLFEPFFTTKEPDEGTGLGLAQVYGIVKRHGGRIDVETEVGEGTTFHVHLPLQEAEPPAREGRETEAEPRGRGELILLVEDEETLRKAGREALRSLGYRVLAAANAREALDRLDGQRLDLVITDLVMPEMGGGDLVRALANRCPDVPVLAVTGYAASDEGGQLTEEGFCDVLHKPFDASALARAVHRNLCRDVL
jgi:signal transduction histidine kinase/ActR/RegA family two-component response regulator